MSWDWALGRALWPTSGREFVFAGLMLAAIVAALPWLPTQDNDWLTLRLEFVVEIATLLAFGPGPAMLVAACALFTRHLSDPHAAPWRQQLVNAVGVLAALWAAGVVHSALGGGNDVIAVPGDASAIAAVSSPTAWS